jgi:hypothetical protein
MSNVCVCVFSSLTGVHRVVGGQSALLFSLSLSLLLLSSLLASQVVLRARCDLDEGPAAASVHLGELDARRRPSER